MTIQNNIDVQIIAQESTKNEERKWSVYIHTNKTNNKVYIGITQQDPERRWQNGYGYKNNPYFWNAIQKYGWDGFEHIVFAEKLLQTEAERLEILLIAMYDATDSNFGYNFSSGGNVKHLGIPHSAETRQKLSEMRIGRFAGENHPRYGKRHTEESKKKMSQTRSKPVIQLTKNLEFISEFEGQLVASQITGIDNTDISACCRKRRPSAGGFVWMFKKDYDDLLLKGDK